MTLLNNPFVTSGYIAPEYFCDRERETEELLRWLVNENNVAIISTCLLYTSPSPRDA